MNPVPPSHRVEFVFQPPAAPRQPDEAGVAIPSADRPPPSSEFIFRPPAAPIRPGEERPTGRRGRRAPPVAAAKVRPARAARSSPIVGEATHSIERAYQALTASVVAAVRGQPTEPLVRLLLELCGPRAPGSPPPPPQLPTSPVVKQFEAVILATRLHETLPYPLRLPDGSKVRKTTPRALAKLGVGLVVQLLQRALAGPDGPDGAAVCAFLRGLFDLGRDPATRQVVLRSLESVRDPGNDLGAPAV